MPVSGCLESGVEAFLREGTPPVYVGFGSTPDARPAETARMVSGAVRATGRRALLCGGWAGLGGFQRAPEVLGIDEAPHAILFPRVAAVVHHGGAGTTAAALRAGVPQVVIAHLGDQFYHGQRVQQLGVGRCMPRRRLNELRLAAAIQEVLAEPGIAARAGDLADRMRENDGVGETIDALLSAHDASRHPVCRLAT
jgi:sterol 3beta-glucosyltransferase